MFFWMTKRPSNAFEYQEFSHIHLYNLYREYALSKPCFERTGRCDRPSKCCFHDGMIYMIYRKFRKNQMSQKASTQAIWGNHWGGVYPLFFLNLVAMIPILWGSGMGFDGFGDPHRVQRLMLGITHRLHSANPNTGYKWQNQPVDQ